ncbi:hypothetical protein PoB_004524400 [Plakobranchus ocellatus]|uniref:PiggyBac transposable element-derived protein domain-containing protein n=1 Tax=Plakobranchus ocellatus TaxID=259542 RepID=A0AAV4BF55_9GAST|nr:hypothetical protein PoB_004524400 [Plakobranchus ocellatus]
MIDLTTVAGRVIWQVKYFNHALSHADTRMAFIQMMARSLMVAHLQKRQHITSLSLPLKQIILFALERTGGDHILCQQYIHPPKYLLQDHLHKVNSNRRSKDCQQCPVKRDRKMATARSQCGKALCKEHYIIVYDSCLQMP